MNDGMDIKERGWKLVNDHIDNFNSHILAILYTSERLCTYGIFRRWYGLVGDWINIGIPQYVQLGQNPDYGCKIQYN